MLHSVGSGPLRVSLVKNSKCINSSDAIEKEKS